LRQFTLSVAQRWPEARELELDSSPVHGMDGEFFGRLYVFRDVTREREVDRMKSEFVSLVSHELRTPLTSVKGYLDLVLEGAVGEVLPEQREFLTIAKRNADRLAALIADILDLSRIEAGRLELQRTALDLATVVDEAAAALRPLVAEKGQRLTVDVPADLPAVLGDGERVTQVLTNLLSNAHKYTPPGGSVGVVARRDGTRVRVEVRDTGIGLTPYERSRLFTRF
jgi:signal transduction histidine kinase